MTELAIKMFELKNKSNNSVYYIEYWSTQPLVSSRSSSLKVRTIYTIDEERSEMTNIFTNILRGNDPNNKLTTDKEFILNNFLVKLNKTRVSSQNQTVMSSQDRHSMIDLIFKEKMKTKLTLETEKALKKYLERIQSYRIPIPIKLTQTQVKHSSRSQHRNRQRLSRSIQSQRTNYRSEQRKHESGQQFPKHQTSYLKVLQKQEQIILERLKELKGIDEKY